MKNKMKAKVYLEIELPEPDFKFHLPDLERFVSSHLFGGLVSEVNPFQGSIKKISMSIKIDND